MAAKEKPNDSFQLFQIIKQKVVLFGAFIQKLISAILLSLVYLVGGSLTVLFARLFRKRFLDTSLFGKKSTYWIESSKEKRPFRQF